MRLGLRLKKQRRKRVRERTTIKSASSCGGAAMAELGCAHGARLCKAPQAHGEKTAGQHALGARNGARARAALRRLCGKGYLALRPAAGVDWRRAQRKCKAQTFIKITVPTATATRAKAAKALTQHWQATARC